MPMFARTFLAKSARDLNYLYDCCIQKKPREKRFKEMFCEYEEDLRSCNNNGRFIHCQYWITSKKMHEFYKNKNNEHGNNNHLTQLEFAKEIYDEFEKDYCFKKHRDWCIYEIYGDEEILRDGIKKAGRTLHALCHAPIELIQYRSIGNNLSYNEQILKDMKAAEHEKDPGKKSKLEKEGKFLLHKEQFNQHYFEIISLRNTLSEEIKLQEKQISTLIGWLGVFSSVLLSLYISIQSDEIRNSISIVLFNIGPLPIKLSYLLFGMLLFLSLSVFIWYIMVSIKLNEAKDVMYICLGVDIDNPKTPVVCE